MKNYYAILGVLPKAGIEEIRISYRNLVKRFHPDVRGGSAGFFARIHEAYEVLSDPERRKRYDHERDFANLKKTRGERPPAPQTDRVRTRPSKRHHNKARQTSGAQKKRDSRAPLTILTRVMSIAAPRRGRFQLRGFIGNIRIEPTLPDKLWDTTLKKFGASNPERLARHIIQIKLSGERDLVRNLMPRPTDFGVEFEQVHDREKKARLRNLIDTLLGRGPLQGFFGGQGLDMRGAFLPMNLLITVPKGTPLFLRDLTGTIAIGDTEGDLVAKMLGGVLKTGRVERTNLILNGSSRAFIGTAGGNVDLMGFGSSKTYLSGTIGRMRAVLDNHAQAEIDAPVSDLLAEVNGYGALRVNQTVQHGRCDAKDYGRIQLSSIAGPMEIYRSLTANVETAFLSPNLAQSG